MSRIHCNADRCPDKAKYNTLIYTITCGECYRNKMKLMSPTCKCTLIEVCDECHDEMEMEYHE